MTKNSSSLLLKAEGLIKHLRIVNWNAKDDKKNIHYIPRSEIKLSFKCDFEILKMLVFLEHCKH